MKRSESRSAFSVPEGSDRLIVTVQKPTRYLGGEINSQKKNLCEIETRVALCFPDVYEIGMSHLGLKILYSILNENHSIYAERAFAPWIDAEAAMRNRNEPLRSLETGTPLDEFDIVGFSLQYELCVSNVLQMLDLGRIPLTSNERNIDHPFVIGGGPLTFNPTPIKLFFDAFAIGEAEETILELCAQHAVWKSEGGSRDELLQRWAKIDGIYVPSVHDVSKKVITKRFVSDLNSAYFPVKPVVPFCEIVHDRAGVEIARGCTRGCRFCQAGILYRPVRERDVSNICTTIESILANTGWEEAALLSLSAGDYSQISELIKVLVQRLGNKKTALSLPSMRTDSFDPEAAELIRKIRSTGFTLAPEAGTERLRQVINKGNTESDLERAVKNAFSTGRQSLKLYFMIGLPTETDEDLEGIAELVLKVKRWAPKIKVTASVSTFVPKSHTPFQWAQQISMEETLRRQDVIRSILKRARVGLKFHSPRLSFLEGVLARGDERLGRVIMKAYYLGARFDGWDDQFRLPIWLEALSSERIDPLEFLSSRPVEGSLPWDFIDSGVRKEFLAKEWDKAHGLESTPDCRTEGCSGCGVCDFKEKRLRFSSTSETKSTEPLNTEPISIRRFRLKYAKLGRMSFIGHQDLIRIYERAFRRSGLELAYSQGFHPHPKLRFSPPVAFGVESHAEFLDFDLINCDKAPETLSTELSKALPEGITPMSFGEISLSEQRLSSKIWRVFYRVYLTEGSDDKFSEKISRFLDSEEFLLSRKKKGKTFEMDLRSRVLDMNYSNGTLSFSCLVKQAGSVHPYEAIAAILGMSREDALKYRVVKTDAIQVEE